MSGDIQHLMLEHLKALRAEVASIKADTSDIKARIRANETSVTELRRADVHVFEDQVRQQASLDRLAERVDRLERRLELHD